MNIDAPNKRNDNRNIFLFFTGKLITMVGSSMYIFIIGLYILKLTGSGGNFALTIICGMLPRILLSPFAGVIADRMSRRKLLIGSDAASTVVMLLAFSTVSFAGLSLITVYASLILLSVCSTFYSVSLSSSVMMLVEEDNVQRASSLGQISSSIGSILGPILGGILYAYVSLEMFMLFNGLAFLISTLMGWSLKFKPSASSSPEYDMNTGEGSSKGFLKSFQRSFIEGFHYAKRNHLIWGMIKLAFWINFFISALNVFLPYIIVESLKLNSKQYGTIDAMLAAGMLLMSALLSIRKQLGDPIKSLLQGTTTLSILIISMSLPLLITFTSLGSFVFYMILMLVVGIIIIYINIPIQVTLQKTVEEEYRGRVFGILDTLASAIAPLGMVLFGLTLDWIPSFYIPIISGLGLLLVTLIGAHELRKTPSQTTVASSQQASSSQ
ncbi:MFS family permease [Paenibacillus anaericanus]|uniref:MFS transporter n=1 Tax=Paenibacillus anaericanus TaxID=170367 RepID=UPI00277E9651|nr:MFS transporter [Paenibacillus anaericanus]MDQ0090717.1 MFS family permease [Paenibacillus anaericanus]